MILFQGKTIKMIVTLLNYLFRWVTAACMLDYSTVVIADKFGSVSVIRLPAETNENTQVITN